MVDEKKLKTVNNFAKKRGLTRGRIYQLITKKDIVPVKIDGVLFIKDDDKK
jgi:hypothetical protein